MKKIKILRIIARLNIGGPAIHAILLTDGLDKSRFDTLLISGSVGKDEAEMLYYALQKNVNPHYILELKRELNFLNDILAFKKIYKLIKTEQPDIIHTHTAKAGALGRLAGIIYNALHFNKRIKLVHTFHGHIFNGYFNRFKTLLFILIERFLAGLTSKIITVSDSIKDELISLGITKEDKIKVIPLGFELEKFLAIPPRKNDILHVGIVGRLVSIKNHRLFLKAAAGVIMENPQIKLKFMIIGDGELRKELEEYSTLLGISSKVDFLGWQEDLPKVYSDLDIVALTSINEGTPVSLIEAMASGKPVVATDAGGVRDLLGNQIDIDTKPHKKFKILERGLLVDSQDDIGFAFALTYLIKHNELRKILGTRGREFVKNRFSKNRLIIDIEALYDSL